MRLYRQRFWPQDAGIPVFSQWPGSQHLGLLCDLFAGGWCGEVRRGVQAERRRRCRGRFSQAARLAEAAGPRSGVLACTRRLEHSSYASNALCPGTFRRYVLYVFDHRRLSLLNPSQLVRSIAKTPCRGKTLCESDKVRQLGF